MEEAAVSPLSNWENFYVIVGSAAAALTGLMFVVITLIAGSRTRSTGETTAAFGTPTVVHFCATLLIAGILSAPWKTLWHAGLLLGLCGSGGVIYIMVVVARARHQTFYQPVLEDWIWHIILPLVSYSTLVSAAFLIPGGLPELALFGIASGAVLFLFIGIHNAWDTVTYIVAQDARLEKTQE